MSTPIRDNPVLAATISGLPSELLKVEEYTDELLPGVGSARITMLRGRVLAFGGSALIVALDAAPGATATVTITADGVADWYGIVVDARWGVAASGPVLVITCAGWGNGLDRDSAETWREGGWDFYAPPVFNPGSRGNRLAGGSPPYAFDHSPAGIYWTARAILETILADLPEPMPAVTLDATSGLLDRTEELALDGATRFSRCMTLLDVRLGLVARLVGDHDAQSLWVRKASDLTGTELDLTGAYVLPWDIGRNTSSTRATTRAMGDQVAVAVSLNWLNPSPPGTCTPSGINHLELSAGSEGAVLSLISLEGVPEIADAPPACVQFGRALPIDDAGALVTQEGQPELPIKVLYYKCSIAKWLEVRASIYPQSGRAALVIRDFNDWADCASMIVSATLVVPRRRIATQGGGAGFGTLDLPSRAGKTTVAPHVYYGTALGSALSTTNATDEAVRDTTEDLTKLAQDARDYRLPQWSGSWGERFTVGAARQPGTRITSVYLPTGLVDPETEVLLIDAVVSRRTVTNGDDGVIASWSITPVPIEDRALAGQRCSPPWIPPLVRTSYTRYVAPPRGLGWDA